MHKLFSPIVLAGALVIGVAIFALFVGIPAHGQPPGACGYYWNSNGHHVPRPCGDWQIEASPNGATALCRDGRYSFSEHPFARGTCSYHGGVYQYLR
jgi:hypothetical protein